MTYIAVIVVVGALVWYTNQQQYYLSELISTISKATKKAVSGKIPTAFFVNSRKINV